MVITKHISNILFNSRSVFIITFTLAICLLTITNVSAQAGCTSTPATVAGEFDDQTPAGATIYPFNITGEFSGNTFNATWPELPASGSFSDFINPLGTSQSDSIFCVTSTGATNEGPDIVLDIAIPTQARETCGLITFTICRVGDFNGSNEVVWIVNKELMDVDPTNPDFILACIPGTGGNECQGYGAVNCATVTTPGANLDTYLADGTLTLALITAGDDPNVNNSLHSDANCAFAGSTGNCFRMSKMTFEIIDAPVISSVEAPQLCVGETGTATVTLSEGTPPFSYDWSVVSGDVTLGTNGGSSIEVTANSTGAYELSVTTTVNNGECSDSVTDSATIEENPDLVTSNNGAICFGENIDLLTLVTDNNATSGDPTFHNALPTSAANQLASTTVSPSATTKYYVTKGVGVCAVVDSLTLSVLEVTTTAIGTDVTCDANLSQDNMDGTITLSGFINTEKFDFTTGSTYTGTATYATGAIDIPISGIITNTLPNPVTSQDYTIRIFSADGCFTDRTITLTNVDCNKFDWGDLPDTGVGNGTLNYQTSLADNGARHIIIDGLYLGNSVDHELDGQQTSDASGDGTDEDVTMLSNNMNIVPGNTLHLPLSVTNTTGNIAYLEAWIDWNGDGDFNDSDEMVLDIDDSASLGTFPTVINLIVPINATIGQNIGMRFRLSNTDNMTPIGLANSGEVEDFLIMITCDPKINLPVELSTSN